jgi:UDP-GlcNAc:undecaprenyl-phosphate/decaprenyl-phosphate GlcNAc-1-phosphate transferase
VEAIPTLIALVAAVFLTPSILRFLEEGGHVRQNWRGRAVPFPAGIVIVAVALVALGLTAAIGSLDLEGDGVFGIPVGYGSFYLFGIALLGLVDDAFAGPSRGWRGHAAELRAGRFTTGGLKALGGLLLALFVQAGTTLNYGEYLLSVALLVLTTNLFNLLDLRPGRAVKAFVLLAIGLTLGAADVLGVFEPLWIYGPFIAPILVVGVYDLRERAMLGDTGANLIGGLAGLWMVETLDPLAQGIALAVVLALTLYGEFRSLSVLISWMPLLRQIDSAGRNDADA